MEISPANFRTWFKNTKIININDEGVVVGVPNTFAQDWLRNKYHNQIMDSLKRFVPSLKRIEYQVSTGHQPEPEPEPDELPVAIKPTNQEDKPTAELNASYKFETFVVGNANRLAHAAATAIAKNPGEARYNPLYLYGGVGLGKTHLMQAIGNAIKKSHPNKKIIYAPAEKFTTEFVQALKHKTIDSLKKKYRNCDVLLIDDIQFLSGKEGTQQEFFHTFNTLHQTNRQIVMTSDTRPKSIPQLEPRLSSRFSWGMVADLQTPDLETRQAILQHKCEEKNFDLDPEMVEYTAKQVQNNVRELEGALNAIITHCELYAVKPSMKLIERILEQTGTDRKITHITAETICQTVADFFSLNLVDLLGKRRNKELVHPRQITMYLMRHELAYSFPKIGKALGGKDHTTVMHGVEKIKKELVRNDNLQRDIALIKEKLYVSG